MNYNPEPITYNQWCKQYKPIRNEEPDPYPQPYETYISDSYQFNWNQILLEATKLANGDPDKAFLHIWTELTADDGEELIITNGIRKVNRLQYYICEILFADTIEDGTSLYQEVHDN